MKNALQARAWQFRLSILECLNGPTVQRTNACVTIARGSAYAEATARQVTRMGGYSADF